MENLYAFLMELDKLKGVYRKSYISDLSRNENSAEHSWHIAMAILALNEELNIDIDILKSVKMALVHDICEIGAGDVSLYDPARGDNAEKEQKYIDDFSTKSPLKFAPEIKTLWDEYEAQSTKESRWVKVVDRILPFMMNIKTEGKTWIELGITKSQVKDTYKDITADLPDIHAWIHAHIEKACNAGWLIDA